MLPLIPELTVPSYLLLRSENEWLDLIGDIFYNLVVSSLMEVRSSLSPESTFLEIKSIEPSKFVNISPSFSSSYLKYYDLLG